MNPDNLPGWSNVILHVDRGRDSISLKLDLENKIVLSYFSGELSNYEAIWYAKEVLTIQQLVDFIISGTWTFTFLGTSIHFVAMEHERNRFYYFGNMIIHFIYQSQYNPARSL